MVSVFLGAGFSSLGGVPLASQILDARPEVDRITRQRLVERVVLNWKVWKQQHGGAPEEYLAYLQRKNDRQWRDALWFVALRIALEMGKVDLRTYCMPCIFTQERIATNCAATRISPCPGICPFSFQNGD